MHSRPPVGLKLAHWLEIYDSTISLLYPREKHSKWELWTSTASLISNHLHHCFHAACITTTNLSSVSLNHHQNQTLYLLSYIYKHSRPVFTYKCPALMRPCKFLFLENRAKVSCLCKNKRAWCIHTNLLDKVIKNYFTAAVTQFKMMHHKLYHKNSMLASKCIYI